MTIRGDVTINFSASPRVITVAAPATTISIQDLVDTLRSLEAENLSYDSLLTASGKDSLGAGSYVGITCSLLNSQIAFAARGGPNYTQCTITGGNLVAVGADRVTSISPVYPTDFTQVIVSQSTSPTLVVTDGSGSTPVVVPTAAEIAAAVWDKLPGTPQSGSFGEIVSKKLLTLLNFIGLK